MSSQPAREQRSQRNRRLPAGLGLGRLAWKHARYRRGLLTLMAAGLAAAVAQAATVPAFTAAAADARIQSALRASPGAALVSVDKDGLAGPADVVNFSEFASSRVLDEMSSYVTTGIEEYQLGPLQPATRNDAPLTASALGQRPMIGYVQQLAAHVRLIAGRMQLDKSPGFDLEGIDAMAVTASQKTADRLGINLSDRDCVRSASTGQVAPPQCFKLVGVWRPLDSADPYWQGGQASSGLLLGWLDFMEFLHRSGPTPGAHFRLTYQLNPAQVDSDNAGDLGARLGLVRGDFQGQPDVRVNTPAGVALEQAGDKEGAAGKLAALIEALVGLLAVAMLVLVSTAFLRTQDRELRVIVGQGWPAPRIWALLLAEVFLVLGLATIAGLVLGTLIGAVLADGSNSPTAWASLAGRQGPQTAAAGGVAALLLFFGLRLTAGVRRAGASPGPEPAAGPVSGFRRPGRFLALAGAGVGMLALAQLPQARSAGGGMPEAAFLAAALALLALAGTGLLPISAALTRRLRRGDLATTVAAWELERQPSQHAGLAVLLTLAVAVASFTAIHAAVGDVPSLRAALLASAAVAVGVALTGLAVHLAAAQARRGRTYSSPLLRGTTSRQVRRGLAMEQLVILGHSQLTGLLLGLLLVAAAGPTPSLASSFTGQSTTATVAAAAGVAGPILGVLAGGLLVGWIVRSLASRSGLGGKRRHLA